jgi:hypothetical protein
MRRYSHRKHIPGRYDVDEQHRKKAYTDFIMSPGGVLILYVQQHFHFDEVSAISLLFNSMQQV